MQNLNHINLHQAGKVKEACGAGLFWGFWGLG